MRLWRSSRVFLLHSRTLLVGGHHLNFTPLYKWGRCWTESSADEHCFIIAALLSRVTYMTIDHVLLCYLDHNPGRDQSGPSMSVQTKHQGPAPNDQGKLWMFTLVLLLQQIRWTDQLYEP